MDIVRLVDDIIAGIKNVIYSNCASDSVKELETNAINLYNYYKDKNFERDFDIEDTLLNYDTRDEISRLINDSPWDGVGENPTDCIGLLEIVYRYICPLDSSFEIIVACNPNTPLEILRELTSSDFETEERSTTQSIAELTNHSELLEMLSSSSHGATKWMVAQNPATNSSTLDKLASDSGYANHFVLHGETDSEIFVQFNVIFNPNTSVQALERIADGTYAISGEWTDEFLEDLNLELQDYAKTELQSRN